MKTKDQKFRNSALLLEFLLEKNGRFHLYLSLVTYKKRR